MLRIILLLYVPVERQVTSNMHRENYYNWKNTMEKDLIISVVFIEVVDFLMADPRADLYTKKEFFILT